MTQDDGVSRPTFWLMVVPSVLLAALFLLAPGALTRRLGLRDPRSTTLARCLGVRQVAVLAAFVRRPASTRLWMFVGEDVMDVALSLLLLRGRPPARGARRAALAVAAGLTVADLLITVLARRSRLPDGARRAPLR